LRLSIEALNEIGWSKETLKALSEKLQSIDDRLTSDNDYRFTFGLGDAISEAKFSIAKHGVGNGLMNLMDKGNSINDTLQSIEAKMKMTANENIALQPPVHKKAEVHIASVSKDEVTVVINGQVQSFSQPAVTINGSTLVPLRAIFEKLGAKISWSEETRTVIATKGTTTVILTLNSDQALINGKPVKLTAKAQSINGNTMVPLRFVSEALGAAVKWDGATRAAYIDSAGTSAEVQSQVANGIKVKYGKHTYGSRSQSEYDTVIRIVEEALKGYDESNFGGSDHEYYLEYLDGARWSGNKKDRSARNIGLYYAEAQLGDLVKAGVSKEEIIKVRTLATIAYDLKEGATDPRDGSPRSAYDALAASPRITDCDSDAQVFSLVYDMMGYNTAIIAGNNHAEVLIQIEGKWYECVAGTFRIVDVSKALENGSYIYSLPTDGSTLK
ncbi:stalk domain-containing protein, partial [Paenibacillus sp. EPM92]|uniref:stalk domain-containing protein n=1 Tax=Paenibacillus sp. EPM92 TaxID=1561195 RepID=UPI001916B552